MKKTYLTGSWFLLIIVILFGTVGCNLPSDSEGKLQTRIAGTVAAENLEGPPVGATDSQAPPPAFHDPTLTATLNPTFTLSPTLTLSPTITLTSTLEVPMASVSHGTNCRTGPDKIYDNIGVLMVGEQAEVVGKYGNGAYWVIKNPDRSGECWLWGHYATVVGPTDGLKTYDQPPTPTPAFDWAGNWDISIGPAGSRWFRTYVMNVTTAGREFTGSIDYGGTIITYTGTISDDYLSVSGTWQEDVDENGPFKFYALGVNQFQGNFSDGPEVYGQCGAMGGAGLPSPCYRP